MALSKENKNYYYNLGRTVALVEIINGLKNTFASLVFDNAKEKLPYQLAEALKKDAHNLHKELLEPADVVLNKGDLPSKMMTAVDPVGRYWIGYNHEKSYLEDTYKGIYGKEEITIECHTPEHIDATDLGDNRIDELRR